MERHPPESKNRQPVRSEQRENLCDACRVRKVQQFDRRSSGRITNGHQGAQNSHWLGRGRGVWLSCVRGDKARQADRSAWRRLGRSAVGRYILRAVLHEYEGPADCGLQSADCTLQLAVVHIWKMDGKSSTVLEFFEKATGRPPAARRIPYGPTGPAGPTAIGPLAISGMDSRTHAVMAHDACPDFFHPLPSAGKSAGQMEGMLPAVALRCVASALRCMQDQPNSQDA
jgi:hypothetical protein